MKISFIKNSLYLIIFFIVSPEIICDSFGKVSREEKSINSNLLNNMNEYIIKELPHIRSVLIMRDDKIIFEKYYQGLNLNEYSDIASVTKSFISALIGIAINEGYIKSVNENIIEFFPEYLNSDIDSRFTQITISHLLTMSSGLKWNDFKLPENVDFSNRINVFFNLDFSDEPGKQFNYNSLGIYILSVILTKSTEMSTKEFADKYLFSLIDIHEYKWTTSMGYYHGGHGMSFKTRDLAKFGSLYLNNGVWNNRQLIPTHYINSSTHKQNDGGFPENESYGYLWWITSINNINAYFAAGHGGQFIYVVPKFSLVIIITSNTDKSHIENRKIVKKFIIPSIYEDIGK